MATERSKDANGRFRAKRGDTLIGNIEKEYNLNFNVRSDMKLSTYLNKEGLPSLSKALQKVEKRLQ